jgi:hypothetical protein
VSVGEKNFSQLSIPRRMPLNPLSYFAWLSEQRHWAFLLIGSSLILVLIVVIYPVIAGILLSFQVVRLNRPNLTGFVGLTHYVDLFAVLTFQRALWNTAMWVTLGTIMQFCLGLVTALALNRPAFFEEAGIDGPPTNFDEFLDAAIKLTDESEGRYGFGLRGGGDGQGFITTSLNRSACSSWWTASPLLTATSPLTRFAGGRNSIPSIRLCRRARRATATVEEAVDEMIVGLEETLA